MPPPFVPTLWGDGGTVGGGSDSNSDFDKELNGEQPVNVMNLLQSGGPNPED